MNRTVIRPQGYAVIIPIILVALTSSCFVAIITTPTLHTDFKVIGSEVIMILLTLFFSVNYLKSRFVLLEDEFIYESAFKTSIAQYKNVTAIQLILAPNPHGITNLYILAIKANNKNINASIKSYSKKSLVLLATTLRNKCENASLDALTLNLSLGNLPPRF